MSNALPRSRPSLLKITAITTFCLLVILLVATALHACWDLKDGRPFLYMDETIVFDSVKKVLTADSGQLWRMVKKGGDPRYGQIFYNASALFAVGPFKSYGDPGLIVGVRIAQIVFLTAAYILLCHALLRTWVARTIVLAAMACLPFTSYYLAKTPKPEPLQLLFIALFIALALRRSFTFGWHWLFLGLALGCKISTAPLCVVAGAIALFAEFAERKPLKFSARRGAVTTVCFLGGWLAAVPLLWAAPKLYFQATILNTTHPEDDSRINALTWLSSVFGGGIAVKSYVTPLLGIAVALTCLTLLVIALQATLRSTRPWSERLKLEPGWVLILFGFSLLLPILLKVQRLWGFYLHPGQVLILVGLAMLAENLWQRAQPSTFLGNFPRKVIAASVAVALFTCAQAAPKAWAEYHDLATRTQQPAHVAAMSVYDQVIAAMNQLAAMQETGVAPKRETVAFDPVLYLPESLPMVKISPIWRPFFDWESRPAIIILSGENHLDYFLGKRTEPPASSKYEDVRKGTELFPLHVSIDPANPTNKPYVLYKWLDEGAGLLLRQDIAAKWKP